jgi:hypothetical protein
MIQTTIALVFLAATLMVSVFFAYIFSIKRQQYILYWVVAWALYGFHYLLPGLSPWIGDSPLFATFNHLLFAFAGIAFALGTQLYSGCDSRFPRRLALCHLLSPGRQPMSP